MRFRRPQSPTSRDRTPCYATQFRIATACSRRGGPMPIQNLRHVLAVLADIKLVPLHDGPITRRRGRHETAEARDAPDGVKRELVPVEIVQHDHVERSSGSALFL